MMLAPQCVAAALASRVLPQPVGQEQEVGSCACDVGCMLVKCSPSWLGAGGRAASSGYSGLFPCNCCRNFPELRCEEMTLQAAGEAELC